MKSEFIIAVHALVYMDHVSRSVSSEELSTNICTNAVRVRGVMAKLKKADLISTKEGKSGGYQLSKKGSSIYLGELADALETDVLSITWRSGNLDLPCVISSGMKQVMDECFMDMETLCRSYLSKKSIEDIEKRLYQIQEEKGNRKETDYVNRKRNK